MDTPRLSTASLAGGCTLGRSMNTYNQKPDNSLHDIREALDSVGQVYMLAPAGLGCDLIAFGRAAGRVTFIEVKNQNEARRDVEKLLTKREAALKRVCKIFDIPFHIVFTPEQALAVLGWTV